MSARFSVVTDADGATLTDHIAGTVHHLAGAATDIAGTVLLIVGAAGGDQVDVDTAGAGAAIAAALERANLIAVFRVNSEER